MIQRVVSFLCHYHSDNQVHSKNVLSFFSPECIVLDLLLLMLIGTVLDSSKAHEIIIKTWPLIPKIPIT